MIVKSLAISTTLEIISYILFKNEKNFQYIKKMLKRKYCNLLLQVFKYLKKKICHKNYVFYHIIERLITCESIKKKLPQAKNSKRKILVKETTNFIKDNNKRILRRITKIA